ncbi:hypothetical protein MLD38_005032 [Melastoma candidum]|uniref:Uncharacterized protein n=1 Tax=Melastoma candidum TaxID=119954 RepID=A0ACB9SCG9_9MYRT|nr:hypothetical protein MLD38_005032 [Melastoma candidum]
MVVSGWRRAFCTSLPKHDDSNYSSKTSKPSVVKDGRRTPGHTTPRFVSKFGFFSNPSTPRVPPNPTSTANLRCRTTPSTPSASTPSPSVPGGSPRGSIPFPPKTSTPSSPKSPSPSFFLLKSTLRLSKTRCGICLQNMKAGQGTAIFTAECSHAFHFPCIASHVQNNCLLVCPVCNTTWHDLPLLHSPSPSFVDEVVKRQKHGTNPPSIRVYDDDEPLLSPSSGSRFIPILESDEQTEEGEEEQSSVDFQGFMVDGKNGIICGRDGNIDRNVEVSLLPEAAVISMNKAYGTYAVVLRIKAPSSMATPRASVDLVAVLDVGTAMNGEKLRSMKRAMRVLISSLGDSDRLSIVAFSSTSKRLLPLTRMTVSGRCSARRIVDAVGCTGQSTIVNDALRKAAKVLEDRREKNPTAAIMLLSDGHDQRVHASASKQKQSPSSTMVVSSTRYGSIPVHAIGFREGSTCGQGTTQQDEEFGRCLSGLLSVAVQDLRLQLGLFPGSDPGEITGVYSLMGRPAALGSGVVRVGDLFAEEERELLVELKAPSFCSGAHHVISVGSSYKEPSTRQLVYSRESPLPVPKPQSVAVGSRPSGSSIQRLKNLHVTARAIAESRRLVESSRDTSGAYHLLSSARVLVGQSGSGGGGGEEFVRCLEAELGELQRLRQERQGVSRRREAGSEEKGEALTPTSAWRAAEKLAKVAIMRKSMNRVSDLHGFENARF